MKILAACCALALPACGAFFAGPARPAVPAVAPAASHVRMDSSYTKKDDLLLEEEIERR